MVRRVSTPSQALRACADGVCRGVTSTTVSPEYRSGVLHVVAVMVELADRLDEVENRTETKID